MHYYVNSPGKSQRSQSAMDSYLSSLGLWRKPVARDGFCLFRATSEQVYMTQTHYEKLYRLSKEVFYTFDGIDEDYMWSEADAMNTLSLIVRHNFVIYDAPGVPPHVAIDNGFSKNIRLCRMDSTHLESVFPQGHMESLAICQSIVYEILYNGVFGFNEEDINEAIQIIREQEGKQKRKICRYNGHVSCSFIESSDSSSSGGSGGEQSPEKSPASSTKSDNLGVLIIKPPVPFRIAKALDPLIYRNTELDIWEEDKREARHKAIVYCPGDKCMIVSEEGKKLYHGHIQEVLENESVIAFVEELGERKEVQVDRLRPDKSSKTSAVFKHWQKRRVPTPTMTVDPRMPPPSVAPPPLPQIQNGDYQPGPVSNCKPVNMPPPPPPSMPQMAMPLQPPPIFHQPQPLLTYNGTEHPPPSMTCYGMDGQPFMPPPMMNGTMMPYSEENGMMTSDPGMNSPVVYVPFMETIMPTEVNVDYPPSEDSRGLDLPLNDINTLRFFFNLGVGHYRAVSLLSHSGIANGQSGVVYCQSAPNNNFKTSPSNGYMPIFTTFVQPTIASQENDDRSSNVSNDSGCEANKNENEQENVNNSNEQNNERNSTSCNMSVSDTNSSPPPEVDASSDQGYKPVKRRKYFMYKNLKLIKPIKEIPNKYLDLLKYLSLEKSRCEGEPIILAPPKVNPQGMNQVPTSCNSCQVNLNPTAQTFVPGTNGMMFHGPAPPNGFIPGVGPNGLVMQHVQNNANNVTTSSTNSMPPPPSPAHTACVSSRLPNISKPYSSSQPISLYHPISGQ